MKYAGIFSDSIRDNAKNKYERRPLGDFTNEFPSRTHNSMLVNKRGEVGKIGYPERGCEKGVGYGGYEKKMQLEEYEKRTSYGKGNGPATTTHAGYQQQQQQTYQSPYLRGSQGSSPNINEAVYANKQIYKNPDPYPKQYSNSRSYEPKYRYHYQAQQQPPPTKAYDNYLQKYDHRNNIQTNPISHLSRNVNPPPPPSSIKEPPAYYYRETENYIPNSRFDREKFTIDRERLDIFERPKVQKEQFSSKAAVNVRSRSYVREPTREIETAGGYDTYEATTGKDLLRNLDKVQDKIRNLLKQ